MDIHRQQTTTDRFSFHFRWKKIKHLVETNIRYMAIKGTTWSISRENFSVLPSISSLTFNVLSTFCWFVFANCKLRTALQKYRIKTFWMCKPNALFLEILAFHIFDWCQFHIIKLQSATIQSTPLMSIRGVIQLL